MEQVFSGELSSYEPRIPVDEQIFERIPATLSLSIGAALVALCLGLLLRSDGAGLQRRAELLRTPDTGRRTDLRTDPGDPLAEHRRRPGRALPRAAAGIPLGGEGGRLARPP